MKLKELRKTEKLNQSEIAQKIGIPLMTYNNYENEKTEPNIETLIKLANFYNVTLDYLVGREFSNDIGYLTQEEKEYFQYFQQLSPINKIRIIGEMQGLLLGQN